MRQMKRSTRGDSTTGQETSHGWSQQHTAVGEWTAIHEVEKSGVLTPSSRQCEAFKVRE